MTDENKHIIQLWQEGFDKTYAYIRLMEIMLPDVPHRCYLPFDVELVGSVISVNGNMVTRNSLGGSAVTREYRMLSNMAEEYFKTKVLMSEDGVKHIGEYVIEAYKVENKKTINTPTGLSIILLDWMKNYILVDGSNGDKLGIIQILKDETTKEYNGLYAVSDFDRHRVYLINATESEIMHNTDLVWR